jgi:uncharacterized protein YkwD
MHFRQKIRNFFIPTLQNQLSPYSLRYKTLIFVAVLAITIELAFYAYVNMAFKQNLLLGNIIESIQTTVADILPQVIVEETNNNRINNNEKPLKNNIYLTMAAKLKVDDMVKKGYFSHQGPDGSMAWDWMERVNYSYSYAGENLAVNFFDAKDVVNAWMNSPTHRENILNNHFTDVGIAAARGTYNGKETVFVVQMFGTPAVPDKIYSSLAKKTVPTETKIVVKTDSQSSIDDSHKVAVGTSSPIAMSGELSIAVATSSTSTIPVIVGTVPTQNISLVQKWLVSPRHLARDAYLVLLTYMALVLLIPMYMIYHRHVSASQWLRFKEIFILFRRPITSAVLTFIFVTLAMYLNYVWGKAGSSVYNMFIEKGVFRKL